MSAETIERRLAALEAEVTELKKFVKKDEEPWWRKISGAFANDPVYEKAMKLGRKWRESTRPKQRKRRKKKT